jgi:hypothetical protein
MTLGRSSRTAADSGLCSTAVHVEFSASIFQGIRRTSSPARAW